MGRRKKDEIDFFSTRDSRILFMIALSMLEKKGRADSAVDMLYFLDDEKKFQQFLQIFGGKSYFIPDMKTFMSSMAMAYFFYKVYFENGNKDDCFENLKEFLSLGIPKSKEEERKIELHNRIFEWFDSLTSEEKRFLSMVSQKDLFKRITKKRTKR